MRITYSQNTIRWTQYIWKRSLTVLKILGNCWGIQKSQNSFFQRNHSTSIGFYKINLPSRNSYKKLSRLKMREIAKIGSTLSLQIWFRDKTRVELLSPPNSLFCNFRIQEIDNLEKFLRCSLFRAMWLR